MEKLSPHCPLALFTAHLTLPSIDTWLATYKLPTYSTFQCYLSDGIPHGSPATRKPLTETVTLPQVRSDAPLFAPLSGANTTLSAPLAPASEQPQTRQPHFLQLGRLHLQPSLHQELTRPCQRALARSETEEDDILDVLSILTEDLYLTEEDDTPHPRVDSKNVVPEPLPAGQSRRYPSRTQTRQGKRKARDSKTRDAHQARKRRKIPLLSVLYIVEPYI